MGVGFGGNASQSQQRGEVVKAGVASQSIGRRTHHGRRRISEGCPHEAEVRLLPTTTFYKDSNSMEAQQGFGILGGRRQLGRSQKFPPLQNP